MQRRKFIQVSAVGTTAIVITGISCKSRHPAFYNILDKPNQLSSICDLNTIRELGMDYRRKRRQKVKLINLQNYCRQIHSGNKISSSSDDLFIQHLMNQKIKHDFETDNTVIVNGWVLAVTEARQCALLYAINQ